MRRRILIFILAGAALVAAAFILPRCLGRGSRDWTTKSPEALAAFRSGLDARMRFYLADAAASFRRALELDPDFAAAKVQLADLSRDDDERRRWRLELETVDTSKLSERERFLVELARATRDRKSEIVSRFLASHHQEPWVLSLAAAEQWELEEFETAAALYRRLLEVDPNWVLARNNLGYLAMAQARFAEAEEQFRTYAYVAPDQANPHDSLGELLSLVGRYEEARSELERALAIRPDFCASYGHLVGIAVFEGKSEEIPPLAARAAQHCPPGVKADLECEGRYFAAYVAKDFDAPWREGFASCSGKVGDQGVLYFRLAILAGRRAEAAAELAALDKAVAESRTGSHGKGRARMLEAVALHDKGVSKLAEGDPAAAVALFRAADAQASYWGVDEGRLKLFNQLNLAVALDRAGQKQQAEEVLASVRAVNPAFAGILPHVAERTPGPP
jgi:tetratricopeptide (TPR) repeat protein